MKCRVLGYAAVVCAVAMVASASRVKAQNPTAAPYLETPSSSVQTATPQAPHGPQYLILAPRGGGQLQPLPAQTYSYGWFGATPRQHPTWHTDYYGYRWIWR